MEISLNQKSFIVFHQRENFSLSFAVCRKRDAKSLSIISSDPRILPIPPSRKILLNIRFSKTALNCTKSLAFLLLSCPLENLCSALANKIMEREYPDWGEVCCVQSRDQPQPGSFLEEGREGTLGTRLFGWHQTRQIFRCMLF